MSNTNTQSGGPSSRWVPQERNYEKERASLPKPKPAADHPLSETFVPSKEASTSAAKLPVKQVSKPAIDPMAKDPLSTAARNDPLSADPLSSADPLTTPFKSATQQTVNPRLSVALGSSILTQSSSNITKKEEPVATSVDDNFIPWSAKKISILQEFTTSESIGMQVSFMEGLDLQGKVNAPVDKTQQRLAQLEQQEQEKNQTVQLTQKDYEKHIEKLHEELIKAWNAEEKVKALKIAIQCAKVLADISVIKFYPSKFVLVTEILDTFGKLVYERIASRTDGKVIRAAAPTEVSDQAKETCRNWFYKIASIRELIPRLYVEMAIIKSYNFIQHSGFATVIARLSKMIRGIGDPLVAMYARAYLARKGHEVEPSYKEYLLSGFYDDLYLQNMLKGPSFEEGLASTKISPAEYLHLFSPALDWELQCIGHSATQSTLNEVLEKYKETANPVILKHIVSSFPPELIAANAKNFVLLIKEASDIVPKHQLWAAMGANLVLGAPPKDIQLALLNEIWKNVTKITVPEDYIFVANVYIDYPLKYCSPKETNILLGDILRHVKEGLAYEKLQGALQSIVTKVLNHYQDFNSISLMDNFLPMLDLFSGEALLEVDKGILAAFAKGTDVTSDPIIINTLFTVGKAVHDSINSLTFQDEVRQVSRLIAAFVNKVDYGIDLEKHLNFLVDCRRAFGNLDYVKYPLVVSACNLAMKALKIVKGKHTKKTAAFVRGCIAYCFITIPSMEDYQQRLNLYLLASQVALMNQAAGQADSLFKSAIKLLQEVPPRLEIDGQSKSSDELMVSTINSYLSLLVAVPGSPEQGPFYLIKGLLKVIKEYPWETGSTAKIRIYMSILSLFSTYAQTKFPYHYNNVEANDVLYGGDADYQNELQALISKVLEEILEDLAKMKEDTDESASKNQSRLALDLFNYLLSYAELNTKSATLAVNLYSLAKANADQAYLTNSIQYLKTKEGNLAKELLKKLASM